MGDPGIGTGRPIPLLRCEYIGDCPVGMAAVSPDGFGGGNSPPCKRGKSGSGSITVDATGGFDTASEGAYPFSGTPSLSACPICAAQVLSAHIAAHVNAHLDAQEACDNHAVARELQAAEEAAVAAAADQARLVTQEAFGAYATAAASVALSDSDRLHGYPSSTRGPEPRNAAAHLCPVEHCGRAVAPADWATHAEAHSLELAEALHAESGIELAAVGHKWQSEDRGHQDADKRGELTLLLLISSVTSDHYLSHDLHNRRLLISCVTSDHYVPRDLHNRRLLICCVPACCFSPYCCKTRHVPAVGDSALLVPESEGQTNYAVAQLAAACRRRSCNGKVAQGRFVIGRCVW